MKTTVDGAGRVVIPRGMRAELGLVDGGEVDVNVVGAAIVIEPLNGGDLLEEGRFLVVPPSGRTLTDADVRELRRADQR